MDKEQLFDDFKCIICKSIVKQPKRLWCDHYACESCLSNYIQRSVAMLGYDLYEYMGDEKPIVKPSTNCFVCPKDDCEASLEPPFPEKHSRDWAVQFPNALKLLNCLEICSGKTSRLQTQKLCDVCYNMKTEQTRSKGISLCLGTCMKILCCKCSYIHKTVYPQHELRDIETLERECVIEIDPSDKDTSVTLCDAMANYIDGVDNTIALYCPIHRGLQIKLFCLKCKEGYCLKCEKAGKCSSQDVKTIESEFESILNNNDMVILQARLNLSLEKVDCIRSRYPALRERMDELKAKVESSPIDDTADTSVDKKTEHKKYVTEVDTVETMLSAGRNRLELMENKIKSNLLTLGADHSHRSKLWIVQSVHVIQSDCDAADIDIVQLKDYMNELGERVLTTHTNIEETFNMKKEVEVSEMKRQNKNKNDIEMFKSAPNKSTSDDNRIALSNSFALD